MRTSTVDINLVAGGVERVRKNINLVLRKYRLTLGSLAHTCQMQESHLEHILNGHENLTMWDFFSITEGISILCPDFKLTPADFLTAVFASKLARS